MNIFLDIETLPGETRPDPCTIKPPANYKDPAKIAEWQKENAEEAYRKQALDSMQGRIICVSYARDDEPVKSICLELEAGLIGCVSLAIASEINMGAYLVGWNLKGFDVPWLFRKACHYKQTHLRDALRHARETRTTIIDLMLTWAAAYRDYTSLEAVARFLGIKEGKEVGGSDIYDLYVMGDMEAIKRHCEEDVELTREICRRVFE